MAEGEGAWWGGWLQQSFQAVKDKSAEAYGFLKRDLTEFSNVVQHDTACSIVATANAVRSKLAVEGSSEASEKVKKGLSNILGVITDTLAPPPDKTIDCDVITLVATPAGTTEVYDSTKARLYSLQADPATYCNEPDGPPEQFDAWLASFSLEERKTEVSELLVNSPSIRALYTKMVPAAVAHSEFWQRYFYKVFQLDQEEARRVALKQRAEQTTHSESLGWEEEEDEFLGATSTSRLDFTPPPQESQPPAVTIATTPLSPSQPAFAPRDALSDVTPSISSDSISLPTQLDNHPERSAPEPATGGQPGLSPTNEVTLKVSEARLGSVEEKRASLEVCSSLGGIKEPAAAENGSTREEGPQDLRVFELNSDSGKSTPSNNGKKGSSTDVSEDWEKDFDLDMTEEEVQLALSKADATGEFDNEDWENWD
ncbi:BSD domain-containing protein 1 [Electrophorus electricus]|uniref:BSD domain-containing protein 1 n=1 Tax=Electrophorus electricus TaxID=8005 RepID=UPI000F0A0C87|nr:BSD domain-containing protein 1 [Electrophorus electricus]